MEFKLTRLAPTPSGFLHLGNAFNFLLTKALAEKHNSKILLRIDDLDRERYRKEYVQDIFESLDFLEIKYDLGPNSLEEFEDAWSQSHRIPEYESALEKLRHSGLLFACDCSRKKIQQLDSSGNYLGFCVDRRISLDKKDVAWRMNTLEADLIPIKTYPDRIESHILPQDIAFYVVRKKDGMPSYQLCSVVDDLHYGVDLIVRGKDLFSSSLAQVHLAEILGEGQKFKNITFYHHQLLKGPGKKKLSKSDGATSLQYLIKEGKKLSDIFKLLGEMAGIPEPIQDFSQFKNSFL
ncbi:glutamate--tRNA ligase family protein [Algoriphagus sp. CAU 1675]|uniref:glutamate--tRNA ligase family protein n=1 Tax=Algoriphagus sp. CAU 1675 TaxID=3032597 RepID=UPI0023DC22F9|nr:glutamate--tRNA ligase family protein [Algoriphagus sp. CAU 1675]MDF2157841.1 glutamate--tRNA ligase family protein [Algoriphagus sp. CAU 1675]